MAILGLASWIIMIAMWRYEKKQTGKPLTLPPWKFPIPRSNSQKFLDKLEE
jgi:hypothetical protein